MKKLRPLWFDTLRAAIELVQQQVNESESPSSIRTLVIPESRGGVKLQTEVTRDWRFTLFRFFERFTVLPETKALLDALNASADLAHSVLVDAGGNAIRERGSQLRWLTNFYLLPLVSEYFGGEFDRPLDPDRIAGQVRELEEFLAKSMIEFTMLAPLENFTGPGPIDLKLGVLRLLSEGEIQRFWHVGEHGGVVDRNRVLSWRFCVDVRYFCHRTGPAENSDAANSVTTIVNALRLLKPGHVGVPLVSCSPTGRTFGTPFGTTITSPTLPAALGDQYSLTPKDLESLRRLVQALVALPASRPVRSAMRRFNFALRTLSIRGSTG